MPKELRTVKRYCLLRRVLNWIEQLKRWRLGKIWRNRKIWVKIKKIRGKYITKIRIVKPNSQRTRSQCQTKTESPSKKQKLINSTDVPQNCFSWKRAESDSQKCKDYGKLEQKT